MTHELSQRRACGLLGAHRSMVRYRCRRDRQDVLRAQVCAIAAARPRFGYRRVHAVLLADGHRINHKRVQRLYREERLQLPRRRGRKRGIGRVRELLRAVRPHERWHMDFVSDSFSDGRRFRALTIVDAFSRLSPGIEVARSLPAQRVIRFLEQLVLRFGKPSSITVDNGPEFTSRAMIRWWRKRGTTSTSSTRSADAEWPRRELQREVPRRVPESDLVRRPRRRLIDYRGVAQRLQHDPPHSALGNIPPQAFLDRFHAGQLGHVA